MVIEVMEKGKRDYIGFAAPLLGERAVRLEVLYSGGGVLGLEKPLGVLVDAHPWYEGEPSLVSGLRQQIEKGKAELEKYKLEDVYSVYGLEPEVTGIALLAANKESAEFLRNQMGSGTMTFRFTLLGKGTGSEEDEISCDLPLSKHYSKPKMVVSNKTGKKCRTNFKRLEKIGSYEVWEAELDYMRMHQVRIHAHESGLGIVGESLYGAVEPVYLSKLKRRYVHKEEREKPLYEGICLHLSEVQYVNPEGEKVCVRAGLPKKWKVMLGKLRGQ